jgi:hypothetical protein
LILMESECFLVGVICVMYRSGSFVWIQEIILL